MPEEEYELIPVSPLRRLEKKIEELEAAKQLLDVKEFLKELISIIKMNQEIVQQVIRANEALRIELTKLPVRLDNLISSLTELLSYIKAGGEEYYEERPVSKEVSSASEEKLNQILELNKRLVELNERVALTLEELEKRTRKPTLPPLKKPLK